VRLGERETDSNHGEDKAEIKKAESRNRKGPKGNVSFFVNFVCFCSIRHLVPRLFPLLSAKSVTSAVNRPAFCWVRISVHSPQLAVEVFFWTVAPPTPAHLGFIFLPPFFCLFSACRRSYVLTIGQKDGGKNISAGKSRWLLDDHARNVA